MIIEIVEFYENERKSNYIKGTIHAYCLVNDLGIDIRGIIAVYRKEKFCFFMPTKTAKDEEGNIVHYPIFHFTDVQTQKNFLDELSRKAKEYIDKNGFFPKTFHKQTSVQCKQEILTDKNQTPKKNIFRDDKKYKNVK